MHTFGRHAVKRAGLALMLPLLALGALAQTPKAEAPITDATVEDLVARLSVADAPSPFRAFRPTRAPGADKQCDGNVRQNADANASVGTRNFGVEYAESTPARVDMALQFAVGSDELDVRSRQLLDAVAKALLDPRLADKRFAVAGHTDVSGPRDLNLRLSCARAIAARDHLVSRGVSAERVWAYGFGPDRLLPGHAADNPMHRRVELRRAP
ncbi:MAG: OmpA family protein [Rhodoferax sp.]|nr:OmpA family protein [Rhodoferax sp.]